MHSSRLQSLQLLLLPYSQVAVVHLKIPGVGSVLRASSVLPHIQTCPQFLCGRSLLLLLSAYRVHAPHVLGCLLGALSLVCVICLCKQGKWYQRVLTVAISSHAQQQIDCEILFSKDCVILLSRPHDFHADRCYFFHCSFFNSSHFLLYPSLSYFLPDSKTIYIVINLPVLQETP